jgi:hypothetical protein
MNLNENENKVLAFLADQFSCDAVYWGFDGIAQHIKLDRKQIRRACRSLKKKGLAEYMCGLFNDDGEVAGSGYGATKTGAELIGIKD